VGSAVTVALHAGTGLHEDTAVVVLETGFGVGLDATLVAALVALLDAKLKAALAEQVPYLD
jgi:hypothetical protein